MSRLDKAVQHMDAVAWAVSSIVIPDLDAIASVLHWVRQNRGTVFTAGNGGSAANALHLACHLHDVGIRAQCLNANPVTFSAQANDTGYDTSMTGGLPKLEGQDAVVVFSCSGNSPNILGVIDRAALAKRRYLESNLSLPDSTMHTPGIAFVGGGYVPENASHVLQTDSENFGVVEDVHSTAIHMLKELLLDKSLE
jgi:D-sedoheptulose 7-phosphate isomerase